MGLSPAFGDLALPSAARAAGTYVSGPLANAGQAGGVLIGVHATASSGTPTLNCSLEESADGATWTALTGSSTAQLAGAGNAVAFAVPAKNFVRVTSVVAGTTPNVTYSISVQIFAT